MYWYSTGSYTGTTVPVHVQLYLATGVPVPRRARIRVDLHYKGLIKSMRRAREPGSALRACMLLELLSALLYQNCTVLYCTVLVLYGCTGRDPYADYRSCYSALAGPMGVRAGLVRLLYGSDEFRGLQCEIRLEFDAAGCCVPNHHLCPPPENSLQYYYI